MLRKNIMRSTKEQQKGYRPPVSEPGLFESSLSQGSDAAGGGGGGGGDGDKRGGAGSWAAGDLVTNLSDNLKVRVASLSFVKLRLLHAGRPKEGTHGCAFLDGSRAPLL